MLGHMLSPLSPRQQGLLLTLMLFDRENLHNLLKFLTIDDAKCLEKKAEYLAMLPQKARVEFMVLSLAQMFRLDKGDFLGHIEPSWLSDALLRESSEMRAIIFKNLPKPVKRLVAQSMGDASKSWMLDLEGRSTTNELWLIALSSFEKQFGAMPHLDLLDEFHFRHIILLRTKDLMIVTVEIGSREISRALAELDPSTENKILSHFEASVQSEIKCAQAKLKSNKIITADETKFFLETVFLEARSAQDLFQKAGLFLLAQELQRYSQIFETQLAQRFPHSQGRCLLKYSDLHRRALRNAERTELSEEITSLVVHLSQNNFIDKRFAKLKPMGC